MVSLLSIMIEVVELYPISWLVYLGNKQYPGPPTHLQDVRQNIPGYCFLAPFTDILQQLKKLEPDNVLLWLSRRSYHSDSFIFPFDSVMMANRVFKWEAYRTQHIHFPAERNQLRSFMRNLNLLLIYLHATTFSSKTLARPRKAQKLFNSSDKRECFSKCLLALS